MPRSRDRASEEGNRPSSSSNQPSSSRDVPLVIVSERGRHSDESRRIVRAQAARASAAQSRVTRARNREEREGPLREDPSSPVMEEPSQPLDTPTSEDAGNIKSDFTQKPLVTWLTGILNSSATSMLENAQSLSPLSRPSLSGATNTFSSTGGGMSSTFGAATGFGQATEDTGRLQLPRAVPRGFATLQQRIQISDNLMGLLSRTSCFDFGSPGVEERLHQLLLDLIIGYLASTLSPIPLPGHPIQDHLRVACTCLTIFQGQRANGATFAGEPKYQTGLEAAWSEAMLLDQNPLTEPKSAEASLWAVFIINVTTGSTANSFHELLHNLLQDLQLHYWSQVRNILLDFIYPVSFLDEPCKIFYDKLQGFQISVA